MNRRTFLASLPLLYAGRLFAAPTAPARFLLVFLRGGYDAANVLVPISSSYYYDTRPNIAVPKSAALPLDSDWGLHPALAATLHPMYEKREAAFIAFAGTHDTSRSHFETQDSIELGQPQGNRSYASGFMNRLAAELGGRGAISFTNQLPVAFRGGAQVANVALNIAAKPGVDARQSALIAQMYAGNPLGTQVAEGFAARDAVMRDLGDEMVAASRNAVTARAFETQAQRLAKLMRGEYRLGFVDIGGWDTHVGEGGAQGYLATRLDELGRGLAAFAQAMGDEWRETVVLVISEFGRTFRENGNRGTDHGHGNAMMAIGGSVRGGRVYGRWPGLAPEQRYEGRDLAVTTDFRSVFAEVSRAHLGVIDTRLVFPGFENPQKLGLF